MDCWALVRVRQLIGQKFEVNQLSFQFPKSVAAGFGFRPAKAAAASDRAGTAIG